MKKPALIVLPLFIAGIALSFINKPQPAIEAGGIKWMTWKEAQEAEKTQPRKVFVDVYTEWCGWCKRMDGYTFINPEIVKYVNANFYAVKFDAESREVIHFKGRDYKYIPEGMRGYNELAAEILNNQMSYPTAVYFDESLNEIFPVPGYQEPKMFESIINFVASNSYKSTQFDQFQKSFKGKVR